MPFLNEIDAYKIDTAIWIVPDVSLPSLVRQTHVSAMQSRWYPTQHLMVPLYTLWHLLIDF